MRVLASLVASAAARSVVVVEADGSVAREERTRATPNFNTTDTIPTDLVADARATAVADRSSPADGSDRAAAPPVVLAANRALGNCILRAHYSAAHMPSHAEHLVVGAGLAAGLLALGFGAVMAAASAPPSGKRAAASDAPTSAASSEATTAAASSEATTAAASSEGAAAGGAGPPLSSRNGASSAAASSASSMGASPAHKWVLVAGAGLLTVVMAVAVESWSYRRFIRNADMVVVAHRRHGAAARAFAEEHGYSSAVADCDAAAVGGASAAEEDAQIDPAHAHVMPDRSLLPLSTGLLASGLTARVTHFHPEETATFPHSLVHDRAEAARGVTGPRDSSSGTASAPEPAVHVSPHGHLLLTQTALPVLHDAHRYCVGKSSTAAAEHHHDVLRIVQAAYEAEAHSAAVVSGAELGGSSELWRGFDSPRASVAPIFSGGEVSRCVF